jgi:YbbR domain-containing protein
MTSLRKFDTGPQRLPHAPNATERWLRRIFVEDWSLKLLALAITLGIWFAVTGQRTPIRRQFRGVQLNFHLPTGIEIGNNPPEEVAITVSGPQSDLEQINARDLAANVDVTDRKAGQRVIQLTPGHTQIDLPNGVRLEEIEPTSVSLKLEPIADRELQVEPRIEGTLPDDFELGQVIATPDRIKVRGPASHVSALQKIPTETISIEGRRESFDVPEAAIYIADQKVDALETVNVHIEITQRRKSKTK